jgi:hypothetical protein
MVIAGWILTILPSLMFLASATAKFIKPADLMENLKHIELSDKLVTPIGVVELVCVLLYLIPRTAVLGAVLLTGYLGGAILTHLRVNDPIIIPIVLGIVVWLGLYFRDARVRALLPLVSSR